MMNSLIKILILLAVHGFVSTTAAQTVGGSDVHADMARVLLQQQNAQLQTMTNGSMEPMMAAVRAQMGGTDSAKTQEIFDKMQPVVARMMARQAAALTSPEAQATFQRLLENLSRSTYTDEEAKALVDFYRTPVGSRVIEKTGKLTTSMMQVLTPELIKIMGPIQREFMEEMKGLAAAK